MKRFINKIIVHCSDQAVRYPKLKWDKRFIDGRDIKEFHVKHRGWSHCGYHYVVCEDGRIQQMLSLDTPGFHVKGQNSNSIGICLITPDDKGRYKLTALVQLKRLTLYLLGKYSLSIDDVYTHNFFSGKICPGYTRNELIKFLRR